ncbi:MAG: DUF1365 domain-containing protein [Hyphomonas sp.]|uniref:DUF1365 domain-containing protein n=1 Tax=Hyphomonas sp. TaxID=87 RepID=UPI0017FA5A17|nr:DUF1365 domain-containing protein [Hyphomonas sp.]MBA3069690.1 DUF1365 domain-containing protein [Hyphomonas sp.]MBU3920494.1 DUF1365 domain-containing protein [Alphaproteobacteria bacterium]MBU4062531.1 DUF1365 domain-containing protein [Alphaproteobacteria bacterium]MBU4163882.1 DUF1365 domain-containing protein [Alphaproteobacteria bacterium]
MTDAPLRLWIGQTLHKRFVPFERAFRYKIVLIDVDIDQLDQAGRMSCLFAVNKTGLFAFDARDHGGGDALISLRQWAEEQFASAGVSLGGGKIRLVTFARHLFYKFAPLSLWYGYDREGALRGIIYEVRNTFGERHCYVAAVQGDRSVHSAPKHFYVSPFFDVSGQYRFTLRGPTGLLDVVIENIKDGERTHLASIKARMQAATTANLLRIALTLPFSSLGVTFAIHWQALRIWIRGAKYHPRPANPGPIATVAASDTSVF